MNEKAKTQVNQDELFRFLLYWSRECTDYQKRIKPALTDKECEKLARALLENYDILRNWQPSDIDKSAPPDVLIG